MIATPNKLLFVAMLPMFGLFILLNYVTALGFAVLHVVIAGVTFTLLMANVWTGWWALRQFRAVATGIANHGRYSRLMFAALMIPASAVSAYLTLLGGELSFVFPMLLVAVTPVACVTLVAIIWIARGVRSLRLRALPPSKE